MAKTVSLILLGCTLGSLAVWGHMFRRARHGQPPLDPALRDRALVELVPLWITLIWVGLSLVLRLSTEIDAAAAPFDAAATRRGMQLDVGLQTLIGVVVTTALTRYGKHDLARFGMDLAHWRGQVALGLAGFLAAWVPVLLVLFATRPFRTDDRQHPLLRLLKEEPSGEALVLAVLAAVIVAPLVEELLFRVVVQGALTQRMAPRSAILFTALLFAAVHGFPDSLGLIPLAIVLGYIYYQRHSYLAAVTTHAAFNGVMLLLTVLGGGEL
jgi:membrane protease YdiL (CAAX protease family)